MIIFTIQNYSFAPLQVFVIVKSFLRLYEQNLSYTQVRDRLDVHCYAAQLRRKLMPKICREIGHISLLGTIHQKIATKMKA